MRLLFLPCLLAAAGLNASAQADARAVTGQTASAKAPTAKALFDVHCRKCHGPAGQPSAAMKKLIPELPAWDSAFFARRSDDDILNVLRNGKGKNMKPFSDRLKPEEMQALAKYIRTLKP